MIIAVQFPGATSAHEYTDFVGDITISDNINSLGVHLKFTAVTHQDDMLMRGPKDTPTTGSKGLIPVGSKIAVYGDSVREFIFGGIIVARNMDTFDKYTYDAYDFGFYLNKSMISIQFNNIDATTAIKQAISKQRIQIGHICDIPTKIRKIYHANLVIDVIKDILEQAELETGDKYRIEVRYGNKLFIEKYRDLEIEMVPVPVNKYDSATPGFEALDVKYAQSMEDMKTRVTIVSGTERFLAQKVEERDEDGEKMYGLINEVIRVDGKNASQIKNMAITRLLEVAPMGNSVVIKVFGDKRVRSGRIINIPRIGRKSIYGRYFVESCVHHYSNDVYHTMELEVKWLPSEEDYNA